jgi:hypothetical protein
MKRAITLITALLLIAAPLASCSKPKPPSEPTPIADPTPTANPTPTAEPSPEPSSTAIPGTPLWLSFASGVGAWSTDITMESDGTFSGYYHDTNMGESGADYPNGTMYESVFNGKFADIQKVSDHEYSMKLDYLNVEGTVGAERVEDGIRIVTSEPNGFDSADEFSLYLPGRQTADLPEGFISWASMPMAWTDIPDALPLYGLYNIGGEAAFLGSSVNLDEQT